MAMHISGVTSANTIMKSLDSIPVDILKDFFSKNENAKKHLVGLKNSAY